MQSMHEDEEYTRIYLIILGKRIVPRRRNTIDDSYLNCKRQITIIHMLILTDKAKLFIWSLYLSQI